MGVVFNTIHSTAVYSTVNIIGRVYTGTRWEVDEHVKKVDEHVKKVNENVSE